MTVIQPLFDEEIDDEASGDVLLDQAIGLDAVTEQSGMLDGRLLQPLVAAELELQRLGKWNGLLRG